MSSPDGAGFLKQCRELGPRRVWRYALETAAAYTAYGFFRILPLSLASATGGRLMRFMGPRFSRHKKTVLPQLAMAFPDMDEAAREKTALAVWDNLGRTFAEYAHLGHISDRITVVGAEHLVAARESGRPLIFITGHLANWEIAAIVVREAGIPLYAVYRKPNNPWVDGLLRHARRTGAGDRLIAKGAEGARKILSVMRQKGALGLLVDQKLTGGTPVTFFGKTALTAPAVAMFAQKYGARVHYARIERLSGAYFRVTFSPEVDVPDDQTVFLQQINDELESWVRVHPGQWLWTHRRWGA